MSLLPRLLARHVEVWHPPLLVPCLEWQGARDRGYGKFKTDGKNYRVHRLMYELLTGAPLPEGLSLDHLCRHKACSNPAHLEPVTHAVNMSRAVWRSRLPGAASLPVVPPPPHHPAPRTHCRNGHPYLPDNVHVSRDGSRRCVICMREAWRRKNLRLANLRRAA